MHHLNQISMMNVRNLSCQKCYIPMHDISCWMMQIYGWGVAAFEHDLMACLICLYDSRFDSFLVANHIDCMAKVEYMTCCIGTWYDEWGEGLTFLDRWQCLVVGVIQSPNGQEACPGQTDHCHSALIRSNSSMRTSHISCWRKLSWLTL